MSWRFRVCTLAAACASFCVLGVPAAPAIAQATFVTNSGAYSAHVTSLRDMPFRTVVRQQFDYSCGSAALATLLREHFGRPVNEAMVFNAMYAVGDQAKIRKVGFSLLDMKKYLETIGLSSDGYRRAAKDLETAQEPAIAVIQVGAYRHFVVLKGTQDGKVLVGDPAQGLRVYSLKEFAAVWNGVLFVVHPADQQKAPFNQPAEWASVARHPRDSITNQTLSGFTRALPTAYQITPLRVAGQ